MIPAHAPVTHGLLVRLRSAVIAVSGAAFVYMAVMTMEPSLYTYLLSLPAAGIVLITAWHRVNVAGSKHGKLAWDVRRSGLIMTAIFALGVIAWPLLEGAWTPWIVVIGIWGFANTWLTTPDQPPWHKRVFGPITPEDRNSDYRRRKTDGFPS